MTLFSIYIFISNIIILSSCYSTEHTCSINQDQTISHSEVDLKQTESQRYSNNDQFIEPQSLQQAQDFNEAYFREKTLLELNKRSDAVTFLEYEQSMIKSFILAGNKKHFGNGYYEKVIFYFYDGLIIPNGYFSSSIIRLSLFNQLNFRPNSQFFLNNVEFLGIAYKKWEGGYWLWVDRKEVNHPPLHYPNFIKS